MIGDLLSNDFFKDQQITDKEELLQHPNGIGPWAAPTDQAEICSSRQRLELASAFTTPRSSGALPYIKQQHLSNGSFDGLHQKEPRFYGNYNQPPISQQIRTECASIAEEEDSSLYFQSQYNKVLNTENYYPRQTTDPSFSEIDFIFDNRRSQEKFPNRSNNPKNYFEKRASSLLHDPRSNRSANSVNVSRNPSPLSLISSRERGTSRGLLKFPPYSQKNYDSGALRTQLTQEAEKRALISMAFLKEAKDSASKIEQPSDNYQLKQSTNSYVQLWTMLKHPWNNDNNQPKLKGIVRRKKAPENYQIISTEPMSVDADYNTKRINLSQSELNKIKKSSNNILPHVIQVQRLEHSRNLEQYQQKQQNQQSQLGAELISEFPLGSNLLKRRVNRLSGEIKGLIQVDKSENRDYGSSSRITSNDTSFERKKSRLNSFSIQFSPPPTVEEQLEKGNNKLNPRVTPLSQQQTPTRGNEISNQKLQIGQVKLTMKRQLRVPYTLNNPATVQNNQISFYFKR